jgi:hypothetical protein
LAVVFAAVGFSYPSDDVQGRVTGTQIVGIGAAGEQFGGEFEVPVFDGNDQCARAGAGLFAGGLLGRLRDRVDVSAGLQEQADNFAAAGARGEQ